MARVISKQRWREAHNLEAIADQSLWIWHTFFGLLSEKHDINALNQSPMVASMLYGVSNIRGLKSMTMSTLDTIISWQMVSKLLCANHTRTSRKNTRIFFLDLTMVKRRGSKFVNLHGNNIHWVPITNLCNSPMEPYIVHQVVWCPMQNFTRPQNKNCIFHQWHGCVLTTSTLIKTRFSVLGAFGACQWRCSLIDQYLSIFKDN